MRHVVVVSDLHLCELEPGSGLWMRYRQAAASPDGELVAMIDRLRAEVRGDALELVLNGDVFDFDAPRVLGGRSVFHDQPRDAAHSAPMLAAILHDHAPFVDAIGRVVADGHTGQQQHWVPRVLHLAERTQGKCVGVDGAHHHAGRSRHSGGQRIGRIVDAIDASHRQGHARRQQRRGLPEW